MKRVISLFLLLSYLLSSPGLVYSMHFCGQVITAVSVAQDGDTHCCCRDTGKPASGCCHNQKVTSTVKDIKLTAAQLKLTAPDMVLAAPVLRLVWRLTQLTYPAADVPAAHLVAHAAPPPECPAYVRGHAFLI